jgi:hypothetical protein
MGGTAVKRARVTEGKRTGLLIVAALTLAKLALNVAFHGRYGYFRDELYYIACSDHLDWGYVDHPPLSIAILKLTRLIAGDSLFAIRFPAALATALTIVFTAFIARRLGGGRFAQSLAALAVALSPIVLGSGAVYSMNAFDLLFWALGAFVLVLILTGGSQRLWLLYGVVVGVGVMNKYSMLFFGAGTVAALMLTPRRRDLLEPWIWMGGIIAVVIVLPHVLWEVRRGWPTLEFIHNATAEKNAPLSVGEFLRTQPMLTGFGQALLSLIGFAVLLRARGNTSVRALAWMFPIVTAVMVAGNAKPYYLSPIYFPFIAAGAVATEAGLAGALRWGRPIVTGAVAVLALVALPFVVPILPVDRFIRYQQALDVKPGSDEREAVGDLPQYYADMFGWDAMAAQVAAVYEHLTPEERQHTVIYVRNYGQAGALDFFGRRYGLPKATCAHNNYWYWGTGDPEMRVAIVFGARQTLEGNLADLKGPGRFDEATLAATTHCEHCRPSENGQMIFVCRGAHFTFKEIWSRERHFI